jgi:aryl-alcohol dehydrogenase-like predicted oxidoreductase
VPWQSWSKKVKSSISVYQRSVPTPSVEPIKSIQVRHLKAELIPVTAVQVEYSPWALDIEDPKIALLKTCRELGVTVVAYSPLGRGFLTGGIKSRDDLADDDFRKLLPRFSEENFHRNLELVQSLNEIAKKKGCTAGQLSLAWLLAQGDDVCDL